MVNVSTEFMETIEERTDFMVSAEITFANGSELDLSGDEFSLSNNSLSDSAGLNNFPLGTAIEKVIQIEIFNEDDKYYETDFYGAQIRLKLSLQLSETVETIDYGTYTVISPETYGTTIIVQATDDMYKADADYESKLEYPATLREIVQDICSTTGIYLLTTTFNNDQFVVEEKPEGITFRQVIAMAAMIACGYARFDFQGRLRINSYSTSMFDVTTGLDGGYFDYPDDSSVDLEGGVFDSNDPDVYTSGEDANGGGFNPWNDAGDYSGGNDSAEHYQSGDKASGGYFNPWDDDEKLDGGSFEEMSEYHVLYNFTAGGSGLKIETDDVVITGIQTVVQGDSDEDDITYLAGEEGYVLDIENDLIEGHEEEAVALIGEALIGLKFRPFEGDHVAYPIAEYGDIALVCDYRSRAYPTILTDIDFVFRGYTTFKCSAESPIRNSSTYYGNSDYVKAVIEARKNTAAQLSEYDKAQQKLAELMANSFGVFETKEVLDDGSTIFYLHDKPTLEESTTIWKMTADAFSVSTDGGKTWNAGMDSEGNVVANVLSVIGINFDWAKGGTLTLGGSNNVNGQMRILNSSGTQIGKWDKDGITATSGTFSGSLSGATGTFSGTLSSGTLSSVTGTFTSIYTGSHSSYSSTANGVWAGTSGLSVGQYFRVSNTGALTCTSGTFSGSLNAATGTFTGTLSNTGDLCKTTIEDGILRVYSSSTSTLCGYFNAATISNNSGYKFVVIGSRAGLIISGAELSVSNYFSPTSAPSSMWTGSDQSMTYTRITSSSSGSISYTNRTITFKRGLMVSTWDN